MDKADKNCHVNKVIETVLNPLNFYRLSAFFYRRKIFFFANLLRDINFFLFKTYIPPSCKIGHDTVFGYKGMGTVIHSESVIGQKCVIGHGVTLGTSFPYTSNARSIGPSVGNNTFIGSGAKILGEICVGSNCTIAANAIVLMDIPDNSIVVGMPARIIGQNKSNYRAIVEF